jgi:taurine dioxygenase
MNELILVTYRRKKMSKTTLDIVPASPHIGAEIGNVDLTKPLSPDQIAEIRAALIKYGVVFFREQALDIDSHRAFAQNFGKLHVHVGGTGTASKSLPDHPEVRLQHFDKDSKRVAGEVWHTDQSCAAIPPMGSILRQAIVPPDGGGDTLFASAYAAYDELSPRLQQFLSGLTATHDGALSYDKGSTTKYPTASHPIVAVHPETKRKLLFVNRGFTARINELPVDESNGLLQTLFAHIESPHWQVRFRWRKDSVAFWDNRCTQHFAIWDYWPNTRSGYRVQVEGTAPYLLAA